MLDDKNKFLSTTIFIFTVIGFGIGLTGYIGLNLLQGPAFAGEDSQIATVSVLTLIMILLSLVLGPIISAVTGFISGMKSESSSHAMTISMFGAVLGFYLMIILSLTLSSQAIPENPLYTAYAQQEVGHTLFLTLIQASVPTGIVGLLAAIIGFRVRDIN